MNACFSKRGNIIFLTYDMSFKEMQSPAGAEKPQSDFGNSENPLSAELCRGSGRQDFNSVPDLCPQFTLPTYVPLFHATFH